MESKLVLHPEQEHHLFRLMDDVLLLCDEKGRIVEASKGACSFLDASRQILKRKSLFEIVDQKDHSRLKKAFSRKTSEQRIVVHVQSLSTKKSITKCSMHLTRNGNTILCVLPHDGAQSARQLRLLATALWYADDAISIIDLKGKILYTNEARERLIGTGHHEIIGRSIQKYSHDSETPYLQFIIQQTIENRKWVGDVEYRSADGKSVIVSLVTSLITDEHGKPFAILKSARDITKRKSFELDLLESEHLFRNLIDTMADAILLTDLEGTVLEVNKGFETITGYSKSEVIGQVFPYPWLPDNEMPRMVLWISELRLKTSMHDFDIHWTSKSKTQIAISLNTTMLRNETGEPVAMLNIARDITERTRLAQALEHRTRQIEMLNRIISHANANMMNDELLHLIHDELQTFFSFDQITMWYLDPSNIYLEAAGSIQHDFFPKGMRIPYISSISRFALDQLQPVLINDFGGQGSDCQSTLEYQNGYRSAISIPIHIKDLTIGVFNILSSEPDAFSEQMTILVQPIIDHIALTIEKTRLYSELRNSEEKYRLLVETARDMVFALNLDGDFVYISPSAYNFTGYSPNELHRKGISERTIHPNDLRRLQAFIRLLKRGIDIPHDNQNIEVRIYHKNGSIIWGSVSWTPIINDMGIIKGVQGIVHDITERKLAELKISKQMHQLHVLYEFSRQITSSLDPQEIANLTALSMEKIVPYNSFKIEKYDHSRKTLTTLVDIEIQNGNRIQKDDAFVPEKIQEGTPSFNVVTNRVPFILRNYHEINSKISSEEILPISLIAVPIFSKEQILGVMTIQSEPSEFYTDDHLHLSENVANLAALALEKAMLYKETLEKSVEIHGRNKELDDFTYVVSHDLKEPLLSIEGYSKILFSDFAAGLGEDGAEYLHAISESCRRMKTLIDDLLELSRIGRVSETFAPLSMDELLQEIKEDFEFTLSDRNAELRIQKPMPIVQANKTQMKLVFRNLISNALKFNHSANPLVDIFWEEDETHFRFSVHDNGIGIPEKYFEKIFIIFQRLYPVEEYEGTGAGLTIVKKIVEFHKGRIWVSSREGEGSTFSFTIAKQI